MKTTTPPRLRAKKEKKAPHNDAINQYSLVNIVFSVSSFDRDKTTPANFIEILPVGEYRPIFLRCNISKWLRGFNHIRMTDGFQQR